MAFRSHVARPFDFSLWSNRMLFILVGLSAAAAVVIWANGGAPEVLWTPAHVFVLWSLMREIDPDTPFTAHLAAVVGGVWVLLGYAGPGLLAAGGMILAARIVLNSTGRRPLITDLVVLAVYATVASTSRVGWVAGVGLAIAIYVDGRVSDGANVPWIVTAGAAALGATLVATAAGAFSVDVVDVRPVLVAVVGLVAMVAILRAPPEPASLVDSRRFPIRLDRGRLHAARALISVLVFAAAILYGSEGERVVPLVVALSVALVSAEVERRRRPI
jgi:hypothetical protein